MRFDPDFESALSAAIDAAIAEHEALPNAERERRLFAERRAENERNLKKSVRLVGPIEQFLDDYARQIRPLSDFWQSEV